MRFPLNTNKEKEHILGVIKHLDCSDNWVVCIDPDKRTRSNPQNRLYWAYVRILSRHFGYSDEDFHEILKAEFLGVKEVEWGGKKHVIPNSSKTLTKQAFTEFLEKVMALAIQQGLRLPL